MRVRSNRSGGAWRPPDEVCDVREAERAEQSLCATPLKGLLQESGKPVKKLEQWYSVTQVQGIARISGLSELPHGANGEVGRVRGDIRARDTTASLYRGWE